MHIFWGFCGSKDFISFFIFLFIKDWKNLKIEKHKISGTKSSKQIWFWEEKRSVSREI